MFFFQFPSETDLTLSVEMGEIEEASRRWAEEKSKRVAVLSGDSLSCRICNETIYMDEIETVKNRKWCWPCFCKFELFSKFFKLMNKIHVVKLVYAWNIQLNIAANRFITVALFHVSEKWCDVPHVAMKISSTRFLFLFQSIGNSIYCLRLKAENAEKLPKKLPKFYFW